MMGKTHACAGAALGAVAGSSIGYIGAAAGAAVGAVAALLPDLDHPGSKAGRWLRPLAVWFEWRWGHRDSPTHTLLFTLAAGLALGILAWPLAGPAVLLSGALGGASHLALDAVTKSGVRPFRPFSSRVLRGPITTGSWAERAVQALAGAALAAVFVCFSV